MTSNLLFYPVFDEAEALAGWKRWGRNWLYADLELFKGYRVSRANVTKALPA
jgi:hypothetical protein